jgi:hypothetical protein
MSKSNQDYQAIKLGRRTDAYHQGPAAVNDGAFYETCTAYVYDVESHKTVDAEKFVPQIGQCVLIQGLGLFDHVRTSRIEDFYIHDDYDNSKDKITLKPENAFLLNNIKFDKGDVLLVTLNSLYLLKAK